MSYFVKMILASIAAVPGMILGGMAQEYMGLPFGLFLGAGIAYVVIYGVLTSVFPLDIYDACLKGKMERVKELIEKGTDINKGYPYNRAHLTPICYAAVAGHIEIVNYLLDHGASINDCGENGSTALMNAAVAGHMDIVDLLITQGSDVSVKGYRGKTAADFAKEGGHPEIEQKLRNILSVSAEIGHTAGVDKQKNPCMNDELYVCSNKGAPELTQDNSKENNLEAVPEKLGGWLLFPALGLIISPCILVLFWAIYRINLATGINSHHESLMLFIVLMIDTQIRAYFIYAAWLFFRKKCNTPEFLIFGMVCSILVYAISAALYFASDELSGGFVLMVLALHRIISALIWIPYFRLSKRVKRTFIVP